MKSRMLLLIICVFALTAMVSGELLAQRPLKAPKNPRAVPEGPSEFGLIPPPMDLSHIQAVPGMVMGIATTWDWRALGGVSSVKNQNPYGTCWCFAALGDLESKLLINEMVEYDYSEFNIQACNPSYNDCNFGGNAWMSTNYMALLGSVDETCDPYPGDCPTTTCNNFACSFLKQVTEWRYLPNDVMSIKAAVQTYGPVYVSMYAGFPAFSAYDGSYCLTYAGMEDTNHAVLIVGWDDDMCGGAGAWIVKNSWGTAWGDNGYFYIQYENARIGENANVITGWKNYDPDETIYYYDEWGWWSSVGWSDYDDYGFVEITPAAADEYLYSVDFWAASGPCTYTIWVYDTFSGGALSNLLAGPITGTVTEAGYYSIDLTTPLAVTIGDPIYLTMRFQTPGYNWPVPMDDSGPMESGKTFVSSDGTTWSSLGSDGYAMGDVGIRGRIGPEIETTSVYKDGDPAYFVGFPGGVENVIKGELWCADIAPTNFGFVSGTCPDNDTFCQHYFDLLGWTITADDAEGHCFIQASGTYHWNEVCIQVPCDAPISATNTLTAQMVFCDANGICAPDSGDCEDPNWYSGNPYYYTTTQDFLVVTSPPALYVMQDSIYYVEQGQTAAYIPFAICNGDPCAPTTNYTYVITNKGWVGGPSVQGGTQDVHGGVCEDVYFIVDAGAANVCDYDTLTIIAWDTSSGSGYDTCVQIIHIIEPVPVPIFTMPVVIMLAIAMIVSAAVIMRRRAAGRA